MSWKKIKDKNGKEFSVYEVSIDAGSSWLETKNSNYTFKKLNKNQKYSLQVRPKANPKLVATISVTLGDNPPSKIQNLKVTQIGKNFISLSWNESTDQDNDPVSYEISKDGITWTNIGTKLFWTFLNLLSNKKYNFQVRSTTARSDGESVLIAATTNRISFIAEVGFTSIGLSWPKIIGASDYEVWINTVPIWKSTSNKTSYIFNDLEINKEFIIKVRVKDSKGGIITEERIVKITNIWPELSIAWKTLLAHNVDSIPDKKFINEKDFKEGTTELPINLTTAQINDIINLEKILYDCHRNPVCANVFEPYGAEPKQFQIKNLSPIKHFKKLIEININANQIESIPIEILTNLQRLNLSNNEIRIIPTEIGSLINLESLVLNKNQIESLPTEIGSLTKLQLLHLENNKIRIIPTEIGSLTNLESLALDNNQIESLPTEIGSLTKLKFLELRNNQIESLPTEIGSLTNLQLLYSRNNQIRSIPTEIGSLTNLKVLELRNNQIESLPTEIGSLTNLQNLYLENNEIRIIPTEIGSLINLESLVLNKNQIESLPTEIGSLNNLYSLFLDNNEIKSLPAEIGSLTLLRNLSLKDNEIGSIPTEIGSLRNLRNLYLSNNEITSIPTEIGSFAYLQNLYLDNNQITTISPDIFVNLSYLRSLSLYNQTIDGTNPYTWTAQQKSDILAAVVGSASVYFEK